MLRSMTGYGRNEQIEGERKISAEVRSVNHRYLDISLRLPKIFYPLENDIRKLISLRVTRGKIDLTVQYACQQNGDLDVQADTARAKHVFGLLQKIQAEAGIPGQLDMLSLLPFRDMFLKEPDNQHDLELLWRLVQPVIEQALAGLRHMQDTEGAAITRDLESRIDCVASVLEEIALRAPEALATRQQVLRERVRQLCEGVTVDEQRMVQEIALLADRSDITEEFVRARSHISQLRTWLASPEAVGRKLDFLLQELNREVNTIGSKASDADIALKVVAIKNELEKIREQVQNVM